MYYKFENVPIKFTKGNKPDGRGCLDLPLCSWGLEMLHVQLASLRGVNSFAVRVETEKNLFFCKVRKCVQWCWNRATPFAFFFWTRSTTCFTIMMWAWCKYIFFVNFLTLFMWCYFNFYGYYWHRSSNVHLMTLALTMKILPVYKRPGGPLKVLKQHHLIATGCHPC